MKLSSLLLLFCFSFLWLPTFSETVKQEDKTSEKIIFKFDIKENISPGVWRKTKQAFDEAKEKKASAFLIQMNTYGGTVLDADSIRTKIINSPIPVYVFIDNNAASAGSLISIACDSIYMRKGASMGAATVVNLSGKKMPDKYQSYMRSIMRSTAESHGRDTIISEQDTIYKWFRNPKIAEAMVDESIFIPGIIDTGKILTFTPTEAIKYGFCEGTAEDVPQVLQHIGINNYKIVSYKPSFLEKIIDFLINPVVSGILIMLMIAGLYFEFQSPGIGFPLAIALLAAVAYFAPLYLEGLAAHWEIMLFIGGLILIALEIFVIPGFGIAGISGLILVFAGLVLSLLQNVNFDFQWINPDKIFTALTTVTVSLFIGFLISLLCGKKVFTSNSGVFKNFSLHDIQDKEKGFISVDPNLKYLNGKTGEAYTVLRPSGKVIIEGKIYDAVSNWGMIEKGEKIKVVKVETLQLYVETIADQSL